MTKLDDAINAFADGVDTDAPEYDHFLAYQEAVALSVAAKKFQAAVEEFAAVLKDASYGSARHASSSNPGHRPKAIDWDYEVQSATQCAIDSLGDTITGDALAILEAATKPAARPSILLQIARDICNEGVK